MEALREPKSFSQQCLHFLPTPVIHTIIWRCSCSIHYYFFPSTISFCLTSTVHHIGQKRGELHLVHTKTVFMTHPTRFILLYSSLLSHSLVFPSHPILSFHYFLLEILPTRFYDPFHTDYTWLLSHSSGCCTSHPSIYKFKLCQPTRVRWLNV